jgi:ABC-type glycerol-3-phosphate transport system substrate-binding protein
MVALMFLVSCAPAVAPSAPAGEAAPAAAAGEPVKISMWSWYTEQQDEFPKLAEEFNATHPDIQVEIRVYGGTTDYLPTLEAAIAGGEAPDILAPHVHAIEYGLAGQTVDMKEVLGEEFTGQFFPSTQRQFSAGDAQYAVGWMAQTFGFFYNPALFEQAGVEPPETWDELIEVSGKLKEKGIVPWAFNEADKWLGADFFLPLITQVSDDPNLVYDLDEHTKEGVSWNSEPVIEALRLIDRLVKAEVFQEGVVGTNWDQSTALFYNGGAAMMFAGSWVPQGIVQNAPEEFAKSYGVFKTPAWSEGKRHWTGNQAGAAFSINANGNVEAAAEFMKWLYEADRYSETMNNSLSMPSTEAAAEQVSDPIMKEMTSWLVDGAPHILFGKGSWDAVSNGVQAVFAQTLTPEEAAAQIEADVVAARSR